MARATLHPILLPDPADARAWRPRGVVLLAVVLMVAGAFGPWIAGKFSGDAIGVTLGGDGWLLVILAAAAAAPVVFGFARGIVGLWVTANAVVGGFVCLVHYQQARMDGFRYGWGLYLATVGCGTLAVAGLRWLNAAGVRK